MRNHLKEHLKEIALKAWKDAGGDYLTAVKLLRDRTGFRLAQAMTLIEAVKPLPFSGYHCFLGEDNEPLPLIALMHQQDQEAARNDPQRLAAHRAARGVRKVRGAK